MYCNVFVGNRDRRAGRGVGQAPEAAAVACSPEESPVYLQCGGGLERGKMKNKRRDNGNYRVEYLKIAIRALITFFLGLLFSYLLKNY